MPLYEYACKKCQHSFETLVFNGEPVACPECQGTKLERLMSVPARPRSADSSLPMSSSCNPDTPPCGPGCCRL